MFVRLPLQAYDSVATYGDVKDSIEIEGDVAIAGILEDTTEVRVVLVDTEDGYRLDMFADVPTETVLSVAKAVTEAEAGLVAEPLTATETVTYVDGYDPEADEVREE